jgi:hypothetical protein
MKFVVGALQRRSADRASAVLGDSPRAANMMGRVNAKKRQCETRMDIPP